MSNHLGRTLYLLPTVLLALTAGGCPTKPQGGGKPSSDEKEAPAAQKAPATVGEGGSAKAEPVEAPEPPEEPVKTSEIRDVSPCTKGKAPVDPEIVWTGSEFALVWMDVDKTTKKEGKKKKKPKKGSAPPLEEVVAAMESDDPAVVAQAARDLGTIGTEEAVEKLHELVFHDSPEVKIATIEAFVWSDADALHQYLLGLYRHDDPRVRIAAVEAAVVCSELGPKLSAKELLEDEDPGVRSAALVALAKMDMLRKVEDTEKFMQDDDPGVRMALAEAFVKADMDYRRRELYPGLQDPDLQVRKAVRMALGHLEREKDGYGAYKKWPWTFAGSSEYAACMVGLDQESAEVSEPVVLEAAGAGPGGLLGPVFTRPAGHGGAVGLGWFLCKDPQPGKQPAGDGDERAEVPCRFVTGLWKTDGTPVAEPVVVKATRSSNYLLYHDVRLTGTPAGLYLTWDSLAKPKDTGCKIEPYMTNSVIQNVLVDGTGALQDTFYDCETNMDDFETFPYGPGLMNVVGTTDDVGERPQAHGSCQGTECSFNHPNVERLLVTGAGAAIWYREGKRCVDILPAPDASGAGPATECARPESSRIRWTDDGLVFELTTKEGQTHVLPFVPGDRIPLDLLRKALVKKTPGTVAVWSGHSIGLAWTQGNLVKYRIVGRDGLEE